MTDLNNGQVENSQPISQSEDVVGNGINLKNLQFLNYLGLKDEMFNSDVMYKVDFLAKNMDLDDLMRIDWKTGQDPSIPKIDKIYSFMKLDMMSRSKENELNMINEAKNKLTR